MSLLANVEKAPVLLSSYHTLMKVRPQDAVRFLRAKPLKADGSELGDAILEALAIVRKEQPELVAQLRNAALMCDDAKALELWDTFIRQLTPVTTLQILQRARQQVKRDLIANGVTPQPPAQSPALRSWPVTNDKIKPNPALCDYVGSRASSYRPRIRRAFRTTETPPTRPAQQPTPFEPSPGTAFLQRLSRTTKNS